MFKGSLVCNSVAIFLLNARNRDNLLDRIRLLNSTRVVVLPLPARASTIKDRVSLETKSKIADCWGEGSNILEKMKH